MVVSRATARLVSETPAGKLVVMPPFHTRVTEPELERHAHRLMRPAGPFLALAAGLAVVGVVLLIVAAGWAWALGLVLVVLAGPPAVVGLGLLAVGGVARWAARGRPFA
jgi:hypothetical protein